ncbi:hypothetical protein [Methylobacterium cerastii]|uniref:hypothetical protein n=1 Tax=Methylobacterium cerastii TaxID=932741 RepID=UPI001EE24D26|nr:hypothetical protein [Methylobacterium cerastii]
MMTAINTAFWNELDAKMATVCSDNHEGVSRRVVELAASSESRQSSDKCSLGPAQIRSDWTKVLENIAASKSASEQQQAELREQATARAVLLVELERTQEQVRILEGLLTNARDEAKLKILQVQSEADARLLAMQERADAAIQEAYELMRASELRAENAEGWLRQIAQASLDLAPSDHRVAA